MEHEHVFHENGNAGSGLQFRKLERDDGNSWPALLAVHVVYRGILGDDGMEAVRRANEGRGERENYCEESMGAGLDGHVRICSTTIGLVPFDPTAVQVAYTSMVTAGRND